MRRRKTWKPRCPRPCATADRARNSEDAVVGAIRLDRIASREARSAGVRAMDGPQPSAPPCGRRSDPRHELAKTVEWERVSPAGRRSDRPAQAGRNALRRQFPGTKLSITPATRTSEDSEVGAIRPDRIASREARSAGVRARDGPQQHTSAKRAWRSASKAGRMLPAGNAWERRKIKSKVKGKSKVKSDDRAWRDQLDRPRGRH